MRIIYSVGTNDAKGEFVLMLGMVYNKALHR